MSTTKQQNIVCKQLDKPAGITLPGVEVIALNYQITFPNEGHNKPMPPIAQATIIDLKDSTKEMLISIVVLLSQNVNLELNNLSVIQDFSYTNDGAPYANFYVCYESVPEPSSTFNLFQLNFNADPNGYTPNTNSPKKPIPNLFDLTEIVSFLWDEDPLGSRGTVTTVRPGV